MRLFTALELPDTVRSALACVRDVAEAADPRLRREKWVPSVNLHITVRFFGEVDAGDVERVNAVVADAAASLDPPLLTDPRVVAAPSGRRARMLWAEWTQKNRSLSLIAEELRVRLPDYGPPVEKHIRAHATLCRMRTPVPLEPETLSAANQQLKGLEHAMSVPLVSVVSSRLTPRGPVYATIGTWHFGGQ